MSPTLSTTAAGALSTHPSRFPFANVQVSHDSYRAHSEPALAENPQNPQNLIAGSKFFTDPAHYRFKIGTYYSMDGGKTWHDSGPLPGFGSYATTSDVSIAFSAGGVAYVCVLANGRPGSGIFISKSVNGGRTFSRPITVFLDPTNATFSDKPWIAVDQTQRSTGGTIYVGWNLDSNRSARGGQDPDMGYLRPKLVSDQTPVGLVLSRSTDGGSTFSPPVVVNTFDGPFPIGAIPAVGPDGRVYVVYAAIDDKTGRTTSLDMVTSGDGGQTFTTPRTIQRVSGLPNHLRGGTFRNMTLPAFAVSPVDGSMVVAWADRRYGDADILASGSADGGKTWSTATRVNHDRLRDGKDQFMPALAISPHGTYTCAWFDRRLDPHNRRIDEYVAQSYDDGRIWDRNLRVTHKSWNPAIDAPRPEGKRSNTFIGDYQALVADDGAVHPLWNDTQNGRSQEIRTASVSVRLLARR